MNLFLVLQNTYDELQMALIKGQQTLALQSIGKMEASTRFIGVLQDMLDAQRIALSEIPFIVVNQGPGPFTTLRTVLACANGLSFASKIPLIGIDGLDAFTQEYSDTRYPNTVILLNAFGQDVYFAIQSDNTLQKGYDNIDTLLAQIKRTIPQEKIRFLGNGTQMFQEKIIATFGQHAFIPKDIPSYCSIQAVGALGFEKWKTDKTGSHQLLPLYLKKHPLDTHV
jgi:tRNA threonylcarbamoyl adenosine modification protein YeaZ